MIKFLDLFLEALKERLDPHLGFFVSKYSAIPTHFPAIKNHTIEVWLINGHNKEQVSAESITARSVEADELEKIKTELLKKTIKNMLERYGV